MELSKVDRRPRLSHNLDILWDGKDGRTMAEGVNVRFGGELQRFIQTRIGESGLYGSASEYIRDLVRRDYERNEQLKWERLRQELTPGLEASEGEFAPLRADDVLKAAKARKRKHKA